jgi:hypothetical protein
VAHGSISPSFSSRESARPRDPDRAPRVYTRAAPRSGPCRPRTCPAAGFEGGRRAARRPARERRRTVGALRGAKRPLATALGERGGARLVEAMAVPTRPRPKKFVRRCPPPALGGRRACSGWMRRGAGARSHFGGRRELEGTGAGAPGPAGTGYWNAIGRHLRKHRLDSSRRRAIAGRSGGPRSLRRYQRVPRMGTHRIEMSEPKLRWTPGGV